jgi:transcriptional regulator with XRE-family HTH domain
MLMEIGQKIKAHRKARGLTLTQVEERTGINNGNLSKIERGQQSLTNESMELLAKAFSVSLSQLFSDSIDESTGTTSINRAGKHCQPVTKYERLGDIPPGENVLISGIELQKGNDGAWRRDTKQEYVFMGDDVRRLASKPADLAAITVQDDTMQPRLFAGDMVVLDTSNISIPATGGVFVLLSDEAISIRRLFRKPGGGMMIVCDNNRYPEMYVSAEEATHATIIGRVKAMRSTSGF